jgi:hypothetical protein
MSQEDVYEMDSGNTRYCFSVDIFGGNFLDHYDKWVEAGMQDDSNGAYGLD